MSEAMTEPFAEINGVMLDGLDFCGRVYRLFEALANQPGAATLLRMRPSSFEKRLLEELLPLAKYVQIHYSAGRYISVRWRDGNQPFDAEFVQRGEYVDQGFFSPSGYLEVTLASHENEHLVRERMESHGFAFGADGLQAKGSRRSKTREITSEVVIYRGDEFVSQMAEIALKRIRAKVSKPYFEHTTLLVVCVLTMCCYSHEWADIVKAVRAGLPEHRFDSIWMYESTQGYGMSL
jgi:hypothetical protein